MSAIIDPAHDEALPTVPDVFLNAALGGEGRRDDDAHGDAHAAAAAAEAQANALRPQGNPHEFLSLGAIMKSEPYANIIVSIPITLGLIVALISDQNHTYSNATVSEYSEYYDDPPPIRVWAILVVIINGLLTLVNILQTRILIKNPAAPNGGNIPWRILIILSRSLNLFWFVWFIVGAVYTFQLMESPYRYDLPYLFNTSFAIVIFTLCSLGVAILFCCLFCVLICCGLGFVLHAQRHNQGDRVENAEEEASHGATDEQVESLPVKTFYEGMIDASDATCSICFGDYVPGEELRFLPCHHHFHVECVDSWFQGSRACPICKHPINKPAPETSYNPTTQAGDANADADHNEDGEVSPLAAAGDVSNGTFASVNNS